MTQVPEQVSLTEVKNRLSEIIERIEREHGRVVITKADVAGRRTERLTREEATEGN